MIIDSALNIEKSKINSFFSKERKSFPSYFKIKELREHYKNNNLYVVIEGDIFAIFVIDKEKFKNLYVKKEKRGKGVTEYIIQWIKYKNKLITIAINQKSRRMKRFAKKYGFKETTKEVQGKESLLTIYEYERFDFIK